MKEVDKNNKIVQLNRRIKNCRGCDLALTRQNALPGEGNLNAKFFFIAQAPGREEDKEGRMFIGTSGKVLDQLFSFLDFDREDVYMTNLVKCFLPKCRKPHQEEINACSKYLDNEIILVDPSILIPLGYHATKAVLGRYKFNIPNRNGFPDLFGNLKTAGKRKIFPLRHPSAVVHNEKLFDTLKKNYLKLNVIMKTCKWYSMCPMKFYYEKGMLSKSWIDQFCKGDWSACTRYKMEEKSIPHPDNMLPDGTIDQTLK